MDDDDEENKIEGRKEKTEEGEAEEGGFLTYLEKRILKK